MGATDLKIIGYITSESKTKVICTDLIAGSEKEMNHYLVELEVEDISVLTIRKIRFGDIIKGMKLGG